MPAPKKHLARLDKKLSNINDWMCKQLQATRCIFFAFFNLASLLLNAPLATLLAALLDLRFSEAIIDLSCAESSTTGAPSFSLKELVLTSCVW